MKASRFLCFALSFVIFLSYRTGIGQSFDQFLQFRAQDNFERLSSIYDSIYQTNDRPTIESFQALVLGLLYSQTIHPSFSRSLDSLSEDCHALADTTAAAEVVGNNLIKVIIKKKLEEAFISFQHKARLDSLSFRPSTLVALDPDLLIKYLKNRLQLRKNASWTKTLSDEDFKKYVLPFKYEHHPMQDSWYLDFAEDIFDAIDTTEIANLPKKEALIDLTNKVLLHFSDFRLSESYQQNAFIPSYDVVKNKAGSCNDKAKVNRYALSSIGVPTTVDFTPEKGNSKQGHSWNTLQINDTSFIAYDPFWTGIQTDHRFRKISGYHNAEYANKDDCKRFAKIYRQTFLPTSWNEPLVTDQRGNVPELFREPRLMDVSDQYFEPHHISVDLLSETEDKYAYLCVYNYGWKAVAWGHVAAQKASFKDVGHEVLYLVCAYENHKLTPLSHAFYLNNDERITYFIPEETKNELELFEYHVGICGSTDPFNLFSGEPFTLKYWKDGEWVVGGVVKGDSKKQSLVFNNIPAEGLYLITTPLGNGAERPFIMMGDQQKWL